MPSSPEGHEGSAEVNNFGESIEELRAKLGEPPAPHINSHAQVFNFYDRITIKRTSGDVESDWYYLGTHPAEKTMILSGKIGPEGKPIYHQDYWQDVAEWNGINPPEKDSERS